jgi:hypothetical protein
LAFEFFNQVHAMVDAAFEVGKQEAESLFAKKQRQLSLIFSDVQQVNQHLDAGRIWLTDYMKQFGSQAGVSLTKIEEKLEAATLSVWYRDLMLRAQQQEDPSDLVHPTLTYQEPDEAQLRAWINSLFRISVVPCTFKFSNSCFMIFSPAVPIHSFHLKLSDFEQAM